MDMHLPKLETWRQEQRLSYEALGALLGCSAVTARRIALGLRQPSACMAHQIVIATRGEVSVLDLHEARLVVEAGKPPRGTAVSTPPEVAP